jgi:uroporphyrin-III C-methyltransferase
MTQLGKVHLIGAGPGDPELLTCKALRLLKEVDVVVYDRLVSPEIMALIPATTRLVAVGKEAGYHCVPQHRINEILVELASEGLRVARLKGGDPLIFGRGSEEAAELDASDIPYDYVPGITAAQGAASSTHVPLTHRGLATGVRYVTGHRAKDADLDLDWDSLTSPETTLVVYMGAANMVTISAELIARGLPASTPAMAIASATTPRERRVVGQLDTIAEAATGLKAPVLFFIGEVVSLYKAEEAHGLPVSDWLERHGLAAHA